MKNAISQCIAWLVSIAAVAFLMSSAHAAPAGGALTIVEPLPDFSAVVLPEYPKESLRNEEQGLSILGFLIKSDGTLDRSAVLSSSGHPMLDSIAERSLSMCRFKPGTVNGNPVDMWMSVTYIWKLEDSKTGINLLPQTLAAAERGGVAAQFSLAMLYNSGADPGTSDGARWMRKAAEGGHPMAQYQLGRSYEQGHGVPIDDQAAMHWYQKSASQGNVLALQSLRLRSTAAAAVPER